MIYEALAVLAKESPEAHAFIVSETAEDMLNRVSQFSGGLTVFKARPDGATNIVCYWTAEWYYAQALATCDLISDPQLQKQCKINAKQAYCDAYGACGEV